MDWFLLQFKSLLTVEMQFINKFYFELNRKELELKNDAVVSMEGTRRFVSVFIDSGLLRLNVSDYIAQMN